MISVIVQLLLAFPKIGSIFLKIRTAYVKELTNRRYIKHNGSINQWVCDDKTEQGATVPRGTEQPRV